jgi:hypothetical protein
VEWALRSKSKEILHSKTCYVVTSQDDERQDDAAEFPAQCSEQVSEQAAFSTFADGPARGLPGACSKPDTGMIAQSP